MFYYSIKNFTPLLLFIFISPLFNYNLKAQIFYDGFESGTISNWISDTGEYSYQDVTTFEPAEGIYCVQQTGNGIHHLTGLRASFTNNQSTEISWRVKTQDDTVANGYVVIGDSDNFELGAIFSYFSDGSLKFHTDAVTISSPVDPNIWYKINLNNFDWVNKTYDIYINDELFYTSFPFRQQSNKFNQIQIYNFKYATAYWDEFIISNNTPPIAICQNYTVQLNNDGFATITPENIDNESTDSQGTITLSVSPNTFNCSNIGSNTVTLTVTDEEGFSDSCTAIVTVVDAIAPQIFCPPNETILLEANDSYILNDYIVEEIVTILDNCTNPIINYSQNPAPGTILEVGVHIISFTAEDYSGNSSNCSFELNLEEILDLNETELFTSLFLFPNPAINKIHLSNPKKIELKELTIYDLTGRKIYSYNLTNIKEEFSIDISNLTKGNYLIIIKGNKKAIIKQITIK